MRIMWHSNAPWAPTGYGGQTALVVPRLRDRLGHDVAISASWGLMGGVLNWDGVPVYPQGFHPYGMDIWGGHAAEFQADVMISLLDAWVLEPERLPEACSWVPWFPIDMIPTPPPVIEKVKRAALPVTMSRFGYEQLAGEGIQSVYVPHCYDPKRLGRDPDARKAARDWFGVDDDAMVYGIVAANKGGYPSRKAIPESIAAFAQIAKRHPDAWLYCHTHLGAEMNGVNIVQCCSDYGVLDRLRAPDQYRNHSGLLGADFMRGVFNGIDVLVNPSMGEGFGVPILEAQACGTPVITGGWTAMSELTWAGWKLDLETEAQPFHNPLGSWMFTPNVGAIADAMESAYNVARDETLKQEAVAGATPYQADHVIETYWKPALALLGQIRAQQTGDAPTETIVSSLDKVAV